MNKIHVTVVSLILGLSSALGIAAATDTVGLRAATTPSVSNVELATRAERLAKAEKAIIKARRSKPPALPAVPASRPSSGAVPQQVVFQRSASGSSSSHSGHDDDDFEEDDDDRHHGHGGGGDDDHHGGDDD